MTIIQPYKSNIHLTLFLMIMVGLTLFAAVWLIVLYNRLVGTNHAIAAAQSDLEKSQIANSEFKDKIFSLLSGSAAEDIVRGRQLVRERTPQYITIGNQWSLASQ